MDSFSEELEQKIKLSTSDSDSDPLIGQVLGGHYRIEKFLGEGGMARVYLARHEILDEKFAIKVLSGRANEKSLARFRQEAKLAINLKHENLSGLHDFGITQQGSPYLVMEYAQGVSLAELIEQEKTLDEKRAIELLIQICDGLSYAHKQGVLHRDIKPSNIMVLRKDGDTCKVIDFGIAKAISEEQQTSMLTETGESIGTPAYMSPEQIEARKLDPRSDLYSLGTVLYELLNGYLPYKHESALSTMMLKLNEVPAEFLPSVSKELKSVVLRCLERDPSQRYQSIDDLKEDLQRVMFGQKPGHGKARASLSQKQKNKIILQVMTFSCLLLAAGLFCNFILLDDLKRLNWQITLNPGRAEPLINRGRLFSKLGDNRKAVADLNKAIEINPNDVMAYVWRAQAQSELGAYKDSLNDANSAIKLAPTVHQGYLQRAVAEIGLSEFQAAVSDCNKVIELNPKNDFNNNYAALMDISISLTEMKEYPQALEAAERALAYSETAAAYNQLGYIQLKMNNPAKSLEFLESALRRGADPVYMVNKAEALLQLGRVKESIDMCNQVLSSQESNPRALAIKGAALLRNGDLEAAKSLSRRALLINPSLEIAKETMSALGKSKI